MGPALVMVACLRRYGLGATVSPDGLRGDLIQLEQAFKAPNLTPAGKTAFDQARNKAVSAMKKDDDAGCHKAIADAMPKAGLTLK